jgi:hypothetical protein
LYSIQNEDMFLREYCQIAEISSQLDLLSELNQGNKSLQEKH